MLECAVHLKCEPLQHALTVLDEFVQKAAPLLPEQVGSGQAAVSADHAQVGDAALNQVACGFQAALSGAKRFTAGAADDRATLRKPPMAVISNKINVQ